MGDAYDGALYCSTRVAHSDLPSHAERIGIIEDAIRNILYAVGEDPCREGLVETPTRVARMYLNELTVGLGVDLATLLTATFKEPHDQLIIVKDIAFYSLCEHHMVPYSGKAHVGYIPDGVVVGLSKLARVVEMASKKLSIQERLTSEIADAVMTAIHPKGVMVVIDQCTHLCMAMRGIKKAESTTITSAIRGVFIDNGPAREEFLNLVK